MAVGRNESIKKDKQDDVYGLYKKDMISFGKWILEQRTSKKMSLELVSRETGIEKSYIHRLESGKRSNPSFITVYLLAKAFGKNLNDVIST
ncbi:helix-turn-helix transcriptional regulator (plasmid) [Brevibacillus halotolerans]|nr:helix-turn-helix transcriptional regulator [Brevibacillus halotolerans]